MNDQPCPYVVGTTTKYCVLSAPTLTDAEREALGRAADWLVQLAKDRGEIQSAGYLADDAATLRTLLERLR